MADPSNARFSHSRITRFGFAPPAQVSPDAARALGVDAVLHLAA
jgi:hypothetical protein